MIKESDLEIILIETSKRIESSIKNRDVQSANYWMLEHIKDINKFSGHVSTRYLLYCAKRYQAYDEQINQIALNG
jgi:hypothetical protein